MRLDIIIMPMSIESAIALMNLLQLASPALPVGAYSYSEGLEYLVSKDQITNVKSLQEWLRWELTSGSIRMEAAVLLRAYQAVARQDLDNLWYWNAWLSATRESEELRQQSWQMGHSLMRLLPNLDMHSPLPVQITNYLVENNCNFAIAFAISAHCLAIDHEVAVTGYLHSWMTNLVSAGIKLIPLGQTAGQKLIFQMHKQIAAVVPLILLLKDEELEACSWGLSLASMAHETQYTRLFRS